MFTKLKQGNAKPILTGFENAKSRMNTALQPETIEELKAQALLQEDAVIDEIVDTLLNHTLHAAGQGKYANVNIYLCEGACIPLKRILQTIHERQELGKNMDFDMEYADGDKMIETDFTQDFQNIFTKIREQFPDLSTFAQMSSNGDIRWNVNLAPGSANSKLVESHSISTNCLKSVKKWQETCQKLKELTETSEAQKQSFRFQQFN